MPKASDIQVGGSHYKGMAIQHAAFCQANDVPWCEAAALKYICRHRQKNGRQDLEKAIHYLRLCLEYTYTSDTAQRRCPLQRIETEEFIQKNEIPPIEAQCIENIMAHAHMPASMGQFRLAQTVSHLEDLIRISYPA